LAEDCPIKAIEDAKKQILRPDWKKVFEPEAMMESVRRIAGPQVAAVAAADRNGDREA